MTTHSLMASKAERLTTNRMLLMWLGFAALLMLAPHVFTSSLAHSHLIQMGTGIVLALSYNILLGQSGMLSFGHAAFSGLGAFMSVHAMNLAGGSGLWLPLPLIPIVGALTGLAFAALIGYVITRISGVAFAMITLGIGQMAYASSLMFPGFFGGEGGVSTNRVYGEPIFGWSFGPQIQVYYLVAFWLLICVAATFYLTRTPLGRLLNGVRDNEERIPFIGFNPHMLRYMALMTSGLFAGIGGSLMAINFEIATDEVLSLHESGAVLLFTFIGGTTSFFGPILGAIIGVLLTKLLPDYTAGWQMYLGIVFILVVVYAPGGIISLLRPGADMVRKTIVHKRYALFCRLLLSITSLAVGAVVLIELLYHRATGTSDPVTLWGFSLDHQGFIAWAIAIVILFAGLLSIKPLGRALFRQLEQDTALLEGEA
ncbi:branched-chain amino acid ABC transporter permease [Pusillimonas sp. MFBS29]|uniref:branched-chain amino acid ABC transporter permease n=1 Tax=Pusillimonas sp. MFBS29 TaxID=2886690 RepID=UPI001D0FED4D|nr:branched-chain amino acid ABC transporter permease [Pusillimonas sp. MFBS29]MCC2595033.1 branched-chain amino acid ABC transporter permease [Pusillimonas sp. MFBS29]